MERKPKPISAADQSQQARGNMNTDNKGLTGVLGRDAIVLAAERERQHGSGGEVQPRVPRRGLAAGRSVRAAIALRNSQRKQ